MVVENIDIIVRIQENLKRLQDRLKAITSGAKGVVSGLKKTEDQVESLSKRLQKLTGPFLSLLFFGMMLQRAFTSALKSIFEGYKKALPESAKFNQMTNKLSANWEFFKFQLADALADSPLFARFIAFLINILNRLQALSPEMKVFLGVGLAAGAALGFLLMTIGQIGLAIPGLILVGKGFAAVWIGLKTTLAGIQASIILIDSLTGGALATASAFVGPWLAVAAAIGIIALAWKKYVDKFKGDLGLITDDWFDYITIFVGSFINGVAQISLSILQIPTFFADAFVNIIKMAVNFGKTLARIIEAALDPNKTIKDEFDRFFRDTKALFSDPNNYGLTAGLQGLKEQVSEFTLETTRGLTNPRQQGGTVNNYTVITLDEALAAGAITAEGAEALRNLGVTGF